MDEFKWTIPEEVMSERAPLLVERARRRSKNLENWNWTKVRRQYMYGPRGTGSARCLITAERGNHRVTAEYSFSLNNRYRPLVKFLGGFWDGGPFKGEKSFSELAKPLNPTYNQPSTRNSTRGHQSMATTKRAATATKKAAAAPATRTRTRKAAAPAPESEPETKQTAKERNAEEVAARKAARAEERASVKDEVVALRADGKNWEEVSDALGISVGLAQYHSFVAEYDEEYGDDRPEATPEVIREERDGGLSWGRIQAKYLISRKQAWDLLADAGVDHFDSDIGRGGRHINRDPEEVDRRREAAKASRRKGTGRGRKPKFQGFTDETDDIDVIEAVEGKKITWNKLRGEGTDEAVVKAGSVQIKTDKRGNRGISFSDGKKSRTVYVNRIVGID